MAKKSPDRDLIERERKVLELRLLGLSWDAIAQATNYASRGAAWNAYQRALVRTLQEPADEIRQQELERLNRIMTPQLQRAMNGDTSAAMAVLRIMERRARMLGLDAPTRIDAKTEVSVYQGGSDIDAEVARLAQLLEQSSSESPAVDS